MEQWLIQFFASINGIDSTELAALEAAVPGFSKIIADITALEPTITAVLPEIQKALPTIDQAITDFKAVAPALQIIAKIVEKNMTVLPPPGGPPGDYYPPETTS
jgi:hypothetical protein